MYNYQTAKEVTKRLLEGKHLEGKRTSCFRKWISVEFGIISLYANDFFKPFKPSSIKALEGSYSVLLLLLKIILNNSSLFNLFAQLLIY